MTDTRFGASMITANGQRFWPLDPRPDEIEITVIAHHLSRICRWGGATGPHYSVAEHCVHLAGFFLPNLAGRADAWTLARWALLHDAAEAYLLDVVRPLKPYIREYRTFEAPLEQMIWRKFGLEGELPEAVKVADTAILGDERRQLFPEHVAAPSSRPGETGLGLVLAGWPAEVARDKFLTLFRQLFGSGS